MFDYLFGLPADIIKEIFRYLPLKELIKLERLCKRSKKLIRNTKWDHLIVRLRAVKKISFVADHY
jgi:hypothetical protein